ncbi:hypothetical protein AAFP35_10105 [Gordonia sp. CPCC 206044]|uniref:hypothetical protein n=1 Tax=Gordonia sp. CPCC 206044 TaxID=3140793 RepID=UPI003AF3CEE5
MIPKRLLPQTLTYRPILGRNSLGIIYGDPVTVPARVQFGNKVVRDGNGAEIVSSATIYLQPAETLPGLGDNVTLPDGTIRPVIATSDHVGARTVELVTLDVS